jgi:GT2 family glycosyltransferase
VHDDAQVWSGDVEQRVRGLADELDTLRRWWPVRIARSVERRSRPHRGQLRRVIRRPRTGPPAIDEPPQAVAAAVAAARRSMAEGRWDEAERLLLASRREHPGRIDLLVLHAECAMGSGAFQQAELRWRRMLDVFGPLVPDEAVARLAFALRMRGVPGDAAALIRSSRPARTPAGRAIVHFELGAALAEDGRSEEALDVFVSLAAAEDLPDQLRLATDSLILSVARRCSSPVPPAFLPERRIVDQHRARRWPLEDGDVQELRLGAAVRPVPVSFLLDASHATPEQVAATQASIRSLIPTPAGHECIVSDGDAPLESARAAATGTLVVPVRAGDLVARASLLELVTAHAGGATVLIHSGEDRVSGAGERGFPALWPAWDPDLLLVTPCLGGLVAFDRAALERVGGFRPAPEPDVLTGSAGDATTVAVWDAALRLLSAGELGDRGEHVARVARVLLHRGPVRPSDARALGDDELAVTFRARPLSDRLIAHLNGGSMPPRVRIVPDGADRAPRAVRDLPTTCPTVSVIVPTRDRHDLLERCFAALRATAGAVPLELVVVDNGSTEPATLDLLAELERSGGGRVVRSPGAFNFSRLVNLGVAASTGSVVLLLNNDVVATHEGWLEEMLQHALRDDVGAVGALLLHEDGRVQHAGVVVGGNGTAEHAFREWPSEAPGYLGLLRAQRRVSAVTAACMMVRREVYVETGGFDEVDLPVDLNDIDFCLRLGERGLACVWTPFARLLHAEGASRSRGVDQARTAATRAQQQAFLGRWAVDGALAPDPAYHPGLSLVGSTYALAPRG